MVMNVERFEQELPKMLQQARDEKVYPSQDQELINNYCEANDALKEKFQLLPMHYNWKAYWGLEPSTSLSWPQTWAWLGSNCQV
jgi:hypothetical protein